MDSIAQKSHGIADNEELTLNETLEVIVAFINIRLKYNESLILGTGSTNDGITNERWCEKGFVSQIC